MDTHDTIGFGPEDMPDVRRRVFDLAIAQAVDTVDPAHGWDGFLDALWHQLGELFGWDPQDWAGFTPVPAPPLDEFR